VVLRHRAILPRLRGPLPPRQRNRYHSALVGVGTLVDRRVIAEDEECPFNVL
jgi:hypothetical protein